MCNLTKGYSNRSDRRAIVCVFCDRPEEHVSGDWPATWLNPLMDRTAETDLAIMDAADGPGEKGVYRPVFRSPV